jgi:ABC-type transport system involved in multi-copper enzyme maturation permease subunit
VKVRDWTLWLDHAQQRFWFKVVASAIVVGLAIAAMVSVLVARASSEGPAGPAIAEPAAPAPGDNVASEGAGNAGSPASNSARNLPERIDPDAAASAIVRGIVDSGSDATATMLGILVACGLMLIVVWLGLTLTYLSLGIVAAIVGLILPHLGVPKEYVRVGLGAAALGGAFVALMRGARMMLSYPHPLLAIARHVLDEAMRMRIAIVFVVLLIMVMATLPGLLDQEQPLRYRVQSFLQYGTGGIFWMISILIVLFSVATVTFDQRDRTIWQTVTKPVSAVSYVLGKWLGIVTLSAVLLGVSGTGVFLFTAYLRSQPAAGEGEAFVARDGSDIAEDRFMLETQILTARQSVEARGAPIDEQLFEDNVRAKVKAEKDRLGGEWSTDPAEQRSREIELTTKIRGDLRKNVELAYRFIPRGEVQVYTFEGLQEARDSNLPIIFRYRADMGSNGPSDTTTLSFVFPGGEMLIRRVPPGQFSTFPVLPSAIDANGKVEVQIFNGDVQQQLTNADGVSFPPGGLEISYSVGSYQANFLRVMAVFLVKLAFLAMVGVTLGTFLSFPVASLVALTVFFAAEGAGFLTQSLEVFWTEDEKGNVLWFNTAVARIAEWIAFAFSVYSDLRPTDRLVEGLLLSWTDVGYGSTVLLVWTVVLGAAGMLIFSRRELAIYSGHS